MKTSTSIEDLSFLFQKVLWLPSEVNSWTKRFLWSYNLDDFQSIPWTSFTIDPCDEFTDQRQLMGCVQQNICMLLTPSKMNGNVEKMNGIKNCHKKGGQGDTTILQWSSPLSKREPWKTKTNTSKRCLPRIPLIFLSSTPHFSKPLNRGYYSFL